MADDFQPIKERMQEHSAVMEGFLFTVGATLTQCQAFEDVLRQYKIMVFDCTATTTAEQANDLLDKSRKRDTLGGLLRDLANKAKIEPSTKALLDEFVNERNWFIHHFFYLHACAPFNPDTLPPLLQRMRDVQSRSRHLQSEFLKLIQIWAEKCGVPQSQADALATLDKAVKPPI